MKFELQTGMKMPGLKRNQNPFQIARKDFGIKKNKKQDVYDEFTRIVGDDLVTYVQNLVYEQAQKKAEELVDEFTGLIHLGDCWVHPLCVLGFSASGEPIWQDDEGNIRVGAAA
jgi:hypothetical protein